MRRRRENIRAAIIVMGGRYKRRALVRQAIRESLAGCSDKASSVMTFLPEIGSQSFCAQPSCRQYIMAAWLA